MASSDPDTEQYLQAERTFLESEGVDAAPRLVDLERTGGHARVLEAGDGPPVLFMPGAMTTGAVFAGLVGRLAGFRALMVDRPGTGLSPLPSPPPTDREALSRVADHLIVDILDGLDLDAAHVVSTSLGGWYTFRGAAAHPERVRTVCGLAFQVGARLEKAPFFMRMPVSASMTPRRPKVNARIVQVMLKAAGMKSAFRAGKVSDEMTHWMVALLRHTDTFHNESLHNPRPANLRGPDDEVRHSPELLSRVTAPVRLIWGTDDLFGGEASAREFASLLPDAEVRMVAEAGHAPWLDELELVASSVREHLRA